MKSLFCLVILLASMSSYAQSRGGGRIDIGGGRTTIRVEVGNDRTDMNQNERIRRLEEAVRDLQNQVYDLRDQPQHTTVKVNVCSLKTTFDGTFIGKASTRTEAEAMARNKCENARASFCSSSRVDCEVVDEVITVR